MIPTLRYARNLLLAKLGVNPYGINPHTGFRAGIRAYWRLQRNRGIR